MKYEKFIGVIREQYLYTDYLNSAFFELLDNKIKEGYNEDILCLIATKKCEQIKEIIKRKNTYNDERLIPYAILVLSCQISKKLNQTKQ